jgi:hypothetical protein
MTDCTDYNDGNWHGWNGRDCPVHPKSVVNTYFIHDGEEPATQMRGGGTDAGLQVWLRVIAFRVITPYVEPQKPREVWINEYPGDATAVHFNDESAVRSRGNDAKTTRWIEVLE